MKCNAEQIVNGIIEYADSEVISKLPTAGKWILGAGIGILATKTNDVVESISKNKIVQTMGIIDDSGMFDVDLIIESFKCSAVKYGKMTVQLPVIGRLTFSDSDIDTLKQYIER